MNENKIDLQKRDAMLALKKCMRENTECRYVPNTNEAHMYLDVSDTVKIITSAFFSHAMNVASENGFFWQN